MTERVFKLLFILIVIFAQESASPALKSDFKVYAVRYGESKFSKKFIFYGDRSGGTVPFSWMFYYIEYGDKKILVDTGFNDQRMIKEFALKDFKDPVEILKENGIESDKITDVILTHAHFDHTGNAHRFKNARFYINRDELENLKNPYEVKNFLKGNSDVAVFDKTVVLYDTFTVETIGGHTKGSSAVFFNSGGLKYCFTGDEIYLKDNVLLKTGNGSVYNHTKNMEFIEKIIKGNYILFTFHEGIYPDKKERFIKVFSSVKD